MKGGLYNAVALTAFLFTLIFVTNFPIYMLSLRTGILPYHFYLVGSVAFLFSAILGGSLIRIPRANVLLISWFVGLIVLMLASLLLISNINASQDEFLNIAYYSVIAVTFILMAKDQRILKVCGVAVAVSVCILVGISLVEFFNPNFNAIDDVWFQSKAVEGKIQRIGGLYENPNANGYAMALGMFVGQYFLPRNIRFLFAICVGFAVLATVSRSAVLLWTIIVFCSLWMGVYSKGRSLARVFAFFFIAGLASLLLSGQIPVLIESAGLSGFVTESMTERLSGNFFTQEDGSTLARQDLVKENLDKFVSNPVFGIGLGGSNSAEFDVQLGSHNMLLKMGVELGIFGVLVYLALLVIPILANSAQGFMFVIFFFFMNLFTHTSYEKPIFAILISIVILYFAGSNSKKATSRRRRKRRKKSDQSKIAVQ